MTNCEKLQQEVEKVLEGLFEKEKRFMSHLTIARVKEIKNKKSFADTLSKIKLKSMDFNVDRFFLMQSKLEHTGPVYIVLKEFSLI